MAVNGNHSSGGYRLKDGLKIKNWRTTVGVKQGLVFGCQEKLKALAGGGGFLLMGINQSQLPMVQIPTRKII